MDQNLRLRFFTLTYVLALTLTHVLAPCQDACATRKLNAWVLR